MKFLFFRLIYLIFTAHTIQSRTKSRVSRRKAHQVKNRRRRPQHRQIKTQIYHYQLNQMVFRLVCHLKRVRSSIIILKAQQQQQQTL